MTVSKILPQVKERMADPFSSRPILTYFGNLFGQPITPHEDFLFTKLSMSVGHGKPWPRRSSRIANLDQCAVAIDPDRRKSLRDILG